MKAVLLAAGRGERLRPLTDTIPKCLIPVRGKVLLDYWIELFEKYNITEVIINTHYLAQQIYDYIQKHPSKINWTITYEPIILGSAGTLLSLQYILNETFLVCNADNCTNANLQELIDFHKKKQGLVTIGLMGADDITKCGIIGMNNEDLITFFKEKPLYNEDLPQIYYANAGIYVMEPEALKFIPMDKASDLGKDILDIIPKKYGVPINGTCVDIGTLEQYKIIEELYE